MPIAARPDRKGDGRLRIVAIESSLRTGSDSVIRLHYEAEGPLRDVEVDLGLRTVRGEGAASFSTRTSGMAFARLPRSGSMTCTIPTTPLMPGFYSVNVFCTVNGSTADWLRDAATVQVQEGDFFGTGKMPPSNYGSVLVPHRWEAE